jgi:hypothetical protein
MYSRHLDPVGDGGSIRGFLVLFDCSYAALRVGDIV